MRQRGLVSAAWALLVGLLFILVTLTPMAGEPAYRGSETHAQGGEGEKPGVRSGTGGPATDSLLARYNELVDYSDVVVLRNPTSPTSIELADYFISTRQVPPGNVCNITTATTETISRATFDVLRADVESCLTSRGIVDSTNYLVTTKGFPLRVSDSPWWKQGSVDSELAPILGPYAGSIGDLNWVVNPYFNDSVPFSRTTYGVYIVTRITGFTTEEAKGLLGRAVEGIGRKGRYVLDVDPAKSGGYVVGNDWMINAASLLTAKGFDVYLDQTNPFVTGESNVAGYTSWGSNDATWYTNQNTNVGFETDGDGDSVPDGWAFYEEPGIGLVSRVSSDAQAGTWSVQVFRNTGLPGSTYVYQDITPLADTRYFVRGTTNLSGVTGNVGAHLQLAGIGPGGEVLQTFNGSSRTGTTSGWVSLGQTIYEPVQGAVKLRVAAVLTEASGIVNFDSVRLTAIRPHNTWIPGGLAETYVSTGGRSHTYGTAYGQSLVADLIRDGVTGTKGYVYEPYLNVVARPHILFDAITDGYTLGESYFMASQISLSWMDTIMGDPKFAPYNPAFLPDLQVSDADVSAAPTLVASGALVDISVDVANVGNYPVENATLSLYWGDPTAGGQLLTNFTVTVAHGDTANVAFQWDTRGYLGTLDLCAFADATDMYYEVDEANNVGCVPLVIDPPFTIPLVEGLNLVSLPLIQSRTDPAWVLRSIDGEYDRVLLYDASSPQDGWRSLDLRKASATLTALDHTMGFWVNVTVPGGTTLEVGGTYPVSTVIPLRAGWNLVGYPAGDNRTVQVALAGVPWERVETFAPASEPYRLMALAPTDPLTPGMGLWVLAAAASDWTLLY